MVNKEIVKLLDPRIIGAIFIIGAIIAIGGALPWWVWAIIAVLGIVYIIIPVDLLPEAILGIAGMVDDVIVGGIVILSIFFAIVQPFAGSYIYILGIVFVVVSTVMLVIASQMIKGVK